VFANVVLAGLTGSVLLLLHGTSTAQGIYTCVDAKGRRLTSDRPILECIDREQRELTPSGTVKRTLKPSLTADEQARAEEQERRQAEERLRVADDRRRDRALLSRYPNKAAHDKERMDSLAQLGEVAKAANGRIQDLVNERKAIDTEGEFYKHDPSRMPLPLKRRIEENEQNQAAQRRFLQDQQAERARVNARFDEELAKLRPLWAQQAGMPAEAKK
jgi:hypothetical protein